MLIVLFSSFIIALVSTPAGAGTFDGTYDYAYNLRGPEGWETHRVPSGFIVRDGRITSDPPALSGSVDSSGVVRFEGPSPYGGSVAVFTGVIESDGTGEGTYQDQQGLGGGWAVTRVSRSGGFNIERIIYTVLDIFSPIGEFFGASGSTAAAIGVVAVVVPVITIGAIVSTISATRRKRADTATKLGYRRERGYEASQPSPPPTRSQEAPPSIEPPSGPSLLGVGVHHGSPSLPSALNLRAIWGEGRVDLNWDPPLFDTSTYQLDEYVVSKMQYGPRSIVPEKLPLDRLSPENTQWGQEFAQTYRWDTGGDVEGYVVEAMLRRVSSTGHVETIRIGGMVYVPP